MLVASAIKRLTQSRHVHRRLSVRDEPSLPCLSFLRHSHHGLSPSRILYRHTFDLSRLILRRYFCNMNTSSMREKSDQRYSACFPVISFYMSVADESLQNWHRQCVLIRRLSVQSNSRTLNAPDVCSSLVPLYVCLRNYLNINIQYVVYIEFCQHKESIY